MSKPYDFTGRMFGRLAVLRRAPNNRHGQTMWECHCECGTECTVAGFALKQGHTRSCGCLKDEVVTRRWAEYRARLFEECEGAPDDCWEWPGTRNDDGYGVIRSEGAHRASYRRSRGPIPKGRQVLHSCDNPACVNPAHLWLGTQADNMRDMARKGRRRGINVGADNGAAVLTPEVVASIRTRYAAGGVTQEALGEEYGVSQGHISRIVRRYVWHSRRR